jgi:hypothetical protein
MTRLSPFLMLALASSSLAQEPAPVTPPAAAPPAAAAGERCKIVVLNLVGRSLPETDAEVPNILTETLASEVGAVSGCDVVSQADIIAMLDYEKQKAVCTDGNDSCLAEIGAALGAERVIAGTIGRLGADYILAARWRAAPRSPSVARPSSCGARPRTPADASSTPATCPPTPRWTRAPWAEAALARARSSG